MKESQLLNCRPPVEIFGFPLHPLRKLDQFYSYVYTVYITKRDEITWVKVYRNERGPRAIKLVKNALHDSWAQFKAPKGRDPLYDISFGFYFFQIISKGWFTFKEGFPQCATLSQVSISTLEFYEFKWNNIVIY